jgi:hypothetical protein
LSLEKVEPTQRNARSVISATLLNHEAAYLQSMKVTANVKNKKTNNVILEKEQEDMQMAPNSIFNFPIPYEENEMEAGTYVLAMTVEGSGKKWQFTKEFTISKEEAKTFNEKDVTVKKTESKLIYLLIGLLLLLLIICLFIILRLKKQKNK